MSSPIHLIKNENIREKKMQSLNQTSHYTAIQIRGISNLEEKNDKNNLVFLKKQRKERTLNRFSGNFWIFLSCQKLYIFSPKHLL